MPRDPYQLLSYLILVLALNLGLPAKLSGQSELEKDSLMGYVHMNYGLDQDLFNGFQYYKRFARYLGDPFFPEDLFYEGSVWVNGAHYDKLQLKYDIFSQYLIIAYTDFQARYNQLRLNTVHIDSFLLGTNHFHKLVFQNEDPLFYQVLSSGPLTCYIHWQRVLEATHNDLDYSHEYSSPLADYYISHMEVIQTFSNKKSFVSIFPESIRLKLKKYIRHNSISFRSANPPDIQNLLNYLNQLLTEPTGE